MMSVSFACQQAWLFSSEGVGFSGLLDLTGLWLVASQLHIQEEGADRHRGVLEMLS